MKKTFHPVIIIDGFQSFKLPIFICSCSYFSFSFHGKDGSSIILCLIKMFSLSITSLCYNDNKDEIEEEISFCDGENCSFFAAIVQVEINFH